jgi:hypothetical protein
MEKIEKMMYEQNGNIKKEVSHAVAGRRIRRKQTRPES